MAACVISLVIGLSSLGTARKISRSTLELNKETIKIPSYEEIIKENEKKYAENEEKVQNETVNTSEPIENAENTAKTGEAEIKKEDVKAVYATALETEKEITFTHPCEGSVLKKFSIDKPLKSKTMGDFRTHNGVDIKSDIGATVSAAADGIVEKIYTDNILGLTIVISHNENLKTVYANIAGSDMVKEGDEIKKGDAIGCVGNTASGELLDDAHLHFAVISEGKYVNPEEYVTIG